MSDTLRYAQVTQEHCAVHKEREREPRQKVLYDSREDVFVAALALALAVAVAVAGIQYVCSSRSTVVIVVVAVAGRRPPARRVAHSLCSFERLIGHLFGADEALSDALRSFPRATARVELIDRGTRLLLRLRLRLL